MATRPGVFDGTTIQIPRAPVVFKSITTTQNSSVAIWTPTAGKRFRLLRWWIEVSGNAAAAAAGPVTVSLLDGSTQVGLARTVSVPATAGNAGAGNLASLGYDIGPLGYPSTAVNTVLNALLSVALTSGTVRISVAGTEE